jgi:hypothetical protein
MSYTPLAFYAPKLIWEGDSRKEKYLGERSLAIAIAWTPWLLVSVTPRFLNPFTIA